PDAASANAAALAATTGLTDSCPGTVNKTVQTGAGSCDTSIVIRLQDSCGNFNDYTYNTRVDGSKPTATQGTIASCYPDAASANAAALAATTGLIDTCPDTVTKTVQTGAGSCDTSIVIRVQDSCGNFNDYTYNTRVDGSKPTATKGSISSCYPDAASANAAALAATTALTDACSGTVNKTVQTGAGTCSTSI